jgi:ATP-dependent 26S proteasome regulatory subunit
MSQIVHSFIHTYIVDKKKSNLLRFPKAVMRPGRFHRLVYVLFPDEQIHLEIFPIRLRHKAINPYIGTEHFVELTKNYSGAEIAAICDEAGLIPLPDSIDAPHIE